MTPVDLTKWTAESYDRAQIGALKYKAQEAEWQVSADGKSVTQPMNGQPTFFYSDFKSLGAKISVKVDVETRADDDFIGFALNFQPGDTSNQNADFLLLNWDAEKQREGLKLSRVQGIPSFLDFIKLPEVAKGKTLGSKAWEHKTIYQFEFICSKNKLQIWVDGSLEFDLDGEFEDGQFACFDCSQQGVIFSDIQADTKVRFIGGGSPTNISRNVEFSGGSEYGDGDLRFNLTNGTTNDQLSLTSAANPNAKGAISVDSSGSIFLGNGSGTRRIGSINSNENGTNGKALTINFSSPLTNGGFETGDLQGWTAFEQNYSSVYNLNGQSIAYHFTNSRGGTGTGSIIVSTPSGTPSYRVSIDSQTVSSGNYALRLVSSGAITGPSGHDSPSGNGSLHGPYVRSDPFQAFAGDRIAVDFSAQQGSDAYEVFGFLVETGSNTRTQLFAKRGDQVPFNPINGTVPADGEYEFEFVCGSYDKTGGLALGASLFVDNVRLVSATLITDAVIQAITDQVTYSNNSQNPQTHTRHLEITRKTADKVTDSTTVDILFGTA
ncbi:MAG: hypothetical protein F6J96_13030 [Symploca sp. SIO1C2]|nr:hypothetical protein [Symploca sp. SIO1C2]